MDNMNSRQFKIMLCDHRIVLGNYVEHLTPCWGIFREPTVDEIIRHSHLPYLIFEPKEKHGYRVTFYSETEVIAAIIQKR